MPNVNMIIMIGRLTNNPELRYTGSGTAVSNFSLAVNRKWGDDKEETCFIDVTCWTKLAEVVNEYLQKGSTVFIKGRLTQDKWEDNDGNKRSKHSLTAEDVQFLDSRGDYHAERETPPAPGNEADEDENEFGSVPF